MQIIRAKVKTNVCTDAITAAISHYKRQGRKIKTLTLDPLWWLLLVDFLKSAEFPHKITDEVQFKGMTIRKGKPKERMEITLYE